MDKLEALEKIKKHKLLFVDDEEKTLLMMSGLLSDLGLNFEIAKNGIEALAKIKEDASIDIIVSDYFMPKMTGMQLLEILRKENNNINFIFISAHQSMELFDKAEELGASGYLYKPFDFTELVELVVQLDTK